MASMGDITSFKHLYNVLADDLEDETAPQFPKNNMQTLIKLSKQSSSKFSVSEDQLIEYFKKLNLLNQDNNNNVDTFINYLRGQEISLDTFYILLQTMYFTEDRVFLVAIPQLQDSIGNGIGNPSHQILFTRDIVKGAKGVEKSLQFSKYFNSKKNGYTQIEKTAVVFSCNNKDKFLTHLVNTGKNYAYFYYRVWESLFPDLLNGITYTDLILFMQEFDNVLMLEMFLEHWSFHMDNAFFRGTPSIAQGYSTTIKQWFDSTDGKSYSHDRDDLLISVKKLLVNKLSYDPITVERALTPKKLANKRANGFFSIPNKSSIRFIISLYGNGIIPEVLVTLKTSTYFEYMTVLENDEIDYGIKRIKNNQENKSITGMGNTLDTSIRALSPNLKSYFNAETWTEELNIDLLDQFIRTDIDLLLVLIALKEGYNIMELFQYANNERQFQAVSKVNYTQNPSEITFNLAQLIVSKTQNTQTVNIDEDTLKQDCFDTVIKRTLPDVTYDQVKDKLTVVNRKVTFDFNEVLDLSGIIKVMPNIKNTSLSTLQANYNNFTNGNQTNGIRDFDKEKEFCLNLMKVITNK